MCDRDLEAILERKAGVDKPECIGPFGDAFDCPVHDPRKAAWKISEQDAKNIAHEVNGNKVYREESGWKFLGEGVEAAVRLGVVTRSPDEYRVTPIWDNKYACGCVAEPAPGTLGKS